MSDISLADLKNPRWRLENLYKIKTKKAEMVRFKLNPVQEAIEQISSRYKMILKARQFGVTTYSVIKLFDKTIWNPNRTACILAHEQDALEEIFLIVKTAYNSMPPKLRPVVARGGGSKYEMTFPEQNSRIYTDLEVRGGTIDDLHMSEYAYMDPARIKATVQAVPISTGCITKESTANGLNHMHEEWIDPDNGYQKLFYPWFFDLNEYRLPTEPLKLTADEAELVRKVQKNWGLTLTHDHIAFRRFKIAEARGNIHAFWEEYPEDDVTCFLASGHNPFDTFELMKKYEKAIPEKDWELKGEIRQLKPHNKDKTYVIGADVAEGVKADNSVAVVYCIEDKEDVAVFASNRHRPEEFAEIIYDLGNMYRHASRWPCVKVERNNHGHAVILAMRTGDKRYPNIWMAPDEKLGHLTTNITRPLLLDTFVEAVSENMFKINNKDCLGECLTLVDNKGKIMAENKGEADGKKDDRVIAYALAISLALEYLPKINIYKNISKKIITG
jgi:hypothetical protein